MIPVNAAQLAISSAEQLEASNRRISAVEGSVLAHLVSLSTVSFKPSQQDGEVDVTDVINTDYAPDAAAISADSRLESADNAGLSQHDEVMDQAISDLAEAVSQHLTFAKNTVRPLIKTFVDEASVALAGYPEQATYNPQIVKLDLPEVALLPGVESEAMKFKNIVREELTTPLSLPIATSVQVQAALQTGSAALDAAVAEWVQSCGEDYFTSVYAVVFCAAAEGVQDTPDSLFKDKRQGWAALTAAFLMARNLLENVPEGTAYSLSDYRIQMGRMVEQLGLRLSHAYDDRARHLSLETMVLSSERETVFVFAPVYDQWRAAGGLDYLLMGNMLLDRPNVTLPAMLADQEQCMRRWEQENHFLTVTLQNRKHLAAKDTLGFCLDKLVADNLQLCFGEVLGDENLTMNHPEIMLSMERAHAYIDLLDGEDIKDLWTVGTTVVAGYVFSYTGSLQILKGIEVACKNNPGIDPNEAALFSTVEYVSNYVVDQIELRDL